MEKDNDSLQQSQQGTGSSENKGQERSTQLNNKTDLSQEERQNIADEIGEAPEAIASLKDIGALSGRDDNAGAPGDRMEDESTGRETDR